MKIKELVGHNSLDCLESLLEEKEKEKEKNIEFIKYLSNVKVENRI